MACGEGPLWVPEEKALYFVDIDNCKLYRYSDVDNLISHEWTFDEKISWILPRILEETPDERDEAEP